MAFDQIMPASFPLLYQTEWKTEFGIMHDQVRQYMDVYDVSGDRKQFKRLKNVGSRKVVERPDRPAAERRRVGNNTNLGDTEIVNLFTEYYQADDCEIERTEVERLGVQDSPHEAFKGLQKRAIYSDMQRVAVDGILGPRKLGARDTTDDPIPASSIFDAAAGFTYGVFDDIYTDFGAKQVLGQGVEGSNMWTLFCRHKDLQLFRNDNFVVNSDFTDDRVIPKGRLVEYRDGYIVALPDEAFAGQIGSAAAGTPPDGRVRLPFFTRPAVAWGKTGETYANASQPDTWKGNVLLELEEAFGATTLDWVGVRGVDVPV